MLKLKLLHANLKDAAQMKITESLGIRNRRPSINTAAISWKLVAPCKYKIMQWQGSFVWVFSFVLFLATTDATLSCARRPSVDFCLPHYSTMSMGCVNVCMFGIDGLGSIFCDVSVGAWFILAPFHLWSNCFLHWERPIQLRSNFVFLLVNSSKIC